MSRVSLDTSPMVWRLTMRGPDGDRPVEVVMSLDVIEGNVWAGEVRIVGYPGEHTAFPVRACDWIQAHQMMLLHLRHFLGVYATAGALFWRGTDVPFEVPVWRVRKPTLRDRLRAWWAMRGRP